MITNIIYKRGLFIFLIIGGVVMQFVSISLWGKYKQTEIEQSYSHTIDSCLEAISDSKSYIHTVSQDVAGCSSEDETCRIAKEYDEQLKNTLIQSLQECEKRLTEGN